MARAARFDVGSVRGVVRTPQGGVRVEAAVARTGILRYSDGKRSWSEYRPDSEVFSEDSLATLRGAPVTNDHPDSLVVPDNWKRFSVGHAGDTARRDGHLVVADLTVQDADEIKRIESKEHREVSLGYVAEIDWTPGVTPEGEHYDAVQRGIRINHVALLPPGAGRSGPEVALRMDGAAVQVTSERIDLPTGTDGNRPQSARSVRLDHGASMKLFKVGSKEFRRDDDASMAEAQGAVDQQATDLSAVIAGLQKQVTSLLTELAVAKAQADAAKAMEAKEPTEPADEAAAIALDAKLALREAVKTQARKVVGNEVKLDGLPNRKIHELVIKKISPEIKLDSFGADAIEGMFSGIVAATSVRNDALGAVNAAANGDLPASRMDAQDPDEDFFVTQQKRITNAWREKRSS